MHRVFVEDLERRLVLSAAFDVTGLTALRNDPVYSSIDGSGVGVAVLDSGVYARNPDLSANVVAYYNAVENAVPGSIDSSSVAGASDTVGHGTHVSGIAASSNPDVGVAYKAQLVDVKVIPDGGESQLGGDPLLRGLEFVAQYADEFNIKVVNLSLGEADQNGGLNLNSVPNPDDVARAIQELESLGITVVAAAGNSYANDPAPGESYPAVVSTISVASTWADSGAGYDFNVVAWGTPYDSFAAFENSAAADRFSATSQRSTLSNQVAAPGVDIFSTWNNSSSDGAGGNLLYNTLSGTSMAAPFVSGEVALIQDAAMTFGGRYITDVTEVRQIIQQTSDVVVDSNVEDNGRVPLVNGQPDTSRTFDLPETGQSYFRVNVQKAIQFVRQLFSGGAISNADLDNTTATATGVPALTGTRNFSGRGTIGTDGLNPVGANDVDLYKLTLDSPGTIFLTLSQPSGGTAFAGQLRLFDSNGNQITAATGTAAGYPTLSSDPNTPLPVGTYYVGVSSAGNVGYSIVDGSGAAGGTGTGDYLLAINLSNPDPNGVAQGAEVVGLTDPNTLLPGTSIVANEYQGAIGSDPPPTGSTTRIAVPNGDVDMFKVVAPDSGVLTVQTSSQQYGPAGVDSYVRVFDANLNEIAFNDDISQFNTDSFVQVGVQIGQTYYVAVTNYANRSFDVRNPYGRVAGSSTSDRFYNLYLSFDNGDANGTAFLARAAAVGATLADSVGADGGQPLAGAGGGFKDVDFYAYAAPASGILDLSVNATSGGFSPSLALWSLTADQSAVTQIATTTGSGNDLMVQVPAGATIYASVTGKGNENFNWFSLGSGTGGQTGGYTLGSALLPSADLKTLSDGSIQGGTPQPLTVGALVYNNLGRDGSLVVGPGDVDVYALTVPQTGTYEVRTDTSREGSADTVLRLFDASGNPIAANDNLSDRTTASLIRATLTAGQTYYVGVSGAGASALSYDVNTGAGAGDGSTGDYGISVAAVTSGAPPAVSVANAGAVTEPLPGQSAAAEFVVSLDMPAAAPVTVAYATADGTATAGQDYTLVSGVLTFAPGQTTQVVTVPVLGDLINESDETFSLNLSGVSDNAVLSSAAGAATVLNLQVKTLSFDAKHPANYTDASGQPVTLKLSGAGNGTAVFYGSNATPAQITLDGTTSKSRLSMASAGPTALGDLTANGSLGSLAAAQVVLEGNFTVSGSLGAIQVAGASGGHSLKIGSGAAATTLSLGNASDLSVSTPGAIKSLDASTWNNTDGAPDVIAASSIAAMKVPGQFAADLSLSSAAASLGKAMLGDVTGGNWTLAGSAQLVSARSTAADWAAALAGDVGTFTAAGSVSGELAARSMGSIKVGGDLTGATLRAAGSVRSLAVRGSILNSQVRAAGDLASVTAGSLVASLIFAGVSDAVSGVPASAAELSGDALIGSLTVKGAGLPFAVRGSDVAAARLGQVTFGAIDTDNGGVPFGVAAQSIGRYTRRIGAAVLTTTPGGAGQTLDDGGDAVVTRLA